MSVSKARRFVDDVAKDRQLAQRVKPHAAQVNAQAVTNVAIIDFVPSNVNAVVVSLVA